MADGTPKTRRYASRERKHTDKGRGKERKTGAGIARTGRFPCVGSETMLVTTGGK